MRSQITIVVVVLAAVAAVQAIPRNSTCHNVDHNVFFNHSLLVVDIGHNETMKVQAFTLGSLAVWKYFPMKYKHYVDLQSDYQSVIQSESIRPINLNDVEYQFPGMWAQSCEYWYENPATFCGRLIASDDNTLRLTIPTVKNVERDVVTRNGSINSVVLATNFETRGTEDVIYCGRPIAWQHFSPKFEEIQAYLEYDFPMDDVKQLHVLPIPTLWGSHAFWAGINRKYHEVEWFVTGAVSVSGVFTCLYEQQHGNIEPSVCYEMWKDGASYFLKQGKWKILEQPKADCNRHPNEWYLYANETIPLTPYTCNFTFVQFNISQTGNHMVYRREKEFYGSLPVQGEVPYGLSIDTEIDGNNVLVTFEVYCPSQSYMIIGFEEYNFEIGYSKTKRQLAYYELIAPYVYYCAGEKAEQGLLNLIPSARLEIAYELGIVGSVVALAIVLVAACGIYKLPAGSCVKAVFASLLIFFLLSYMVQVSFAQTTMKTNFITGRSIPDLPKRRPLGTLKPDNMNPFKLCKSSWCTLGGEYEAQVRPGSLVSMKLSTDEAIPILVIVREIEIGHKIYMEHLYNTGPVLMQSRNIELTTSIWSHQQCNPGNNYAHAAGSLVNGTMGPLYTWVTNRGPTSDHPYGWCPGVQRQIINRRYTAHGNLVRPRCEFSWFAAQLKLKERWPVKKVTAIEPYFKAKVVVQNSFGETESVNTIHSSGQQLSGTIYRGTSGETVTIFASFPERPTLADGKIIIPTGSSPRLSRDLPGRYENGAFGWVQDYDFFNNTADRRGCPIWSSRENWFDLIRSEDHGLSVVEIINGNEVVKDKTKFVPFDPPLGKSGNEYTQSLPRLNIRIQAKGFRTAVKVEKSKVSSCGVKSLVVCWDCSIVPSFNVKCEYSGSPPALNITMSGDCKRKNINHDCIAKPCDFNVTSDIHTTSGYCRFRIQAGDFTTVKSAEFNAYEYDPTVKVDSWQADLSVRSQNFETEYDAGLGLIFPNVFGFFSNIFGGLKWLATLYFAAMLVGGVIILIVLVIALKNGWIPGIPRLEFSLVAPKQQYRRNGKTYTVNSPMWFSTRGAPKAFEWVLNLFRQKRNVTVQRNRNVITSPNSAPVDRRKVEKGVRTVASVFRKARAAPELMNAVTNKATSQKKQPEVVRSKPQKRTRSKPQTTEASPKSSSAGRKSGGKKK